MKRKLRQVWIVFLILFLPFLIGSQLSRQEIVRQWMGYFSAKSPVRLPGETASVWSPGGIRLSEEQAAARLAAPRTYPLAESQVESENLGTLLIFPQVMDGRSSAANLRADTSIVLINTSNREAEVEVRFFKEDGSPMEVRIDDVQASQFEHLLRFGETLRIQTDAVDPLQVGWAKVWTSQPIGGTAVLSISDLTGRVSAEVGVNEAVAERDFAILADFEGPGGNDTGVAFANANPTESNRVELILMDLEGSEVERDEITLEPSGKRARFVSELFREATAGGFEGVLLIRSEHPVGVMSLRQRRLHLTSLPAVFRYAPGATIPELFFYRVGVGMFEPLRLETSFVIVNNSEVEATFTLDLFQPDGQPLEVTVGGERNSTFARVVPSFGALRLTAEEEGSGKVGWGRLRTDQDVGGVAILTQFDELANRQKTAAAVGDLFRSEVGFEATIPLDEFILFADSIGSRGTGVAVSNPSESNEATYRVNLFDVRNVWKASTDIVLPPLGHEALFFSELFSEVEGIAEFEGRAEVSGTDGVGGSLRLAGSLLTSMPTLFELHGFEPTPEVAFHSLLGDSAPSLTLNLQQFDNDMSLDRVHISIPEVGFDPTFFRDLEPGSVALFADSGDTESSTITAIGFVDAVAEDGTTEIRVDRIVEDGFRTLALLTLKGKTEGNLEADLVMSNRRPNTFNFDSLFLQFFVPSTVFQLPSPGTTFTVETELTSVSTSRRREEPLVNKAVQQIQLLSESASPKILAATPFRGRSQGPFWIEYANLSPTGLTQPVSNHFEVLFTGVDGTEVPAEIAADEDNRLVVVVPDGIMTGPVVLRQGESESNSYKYHVAFAPQTDFQFDSLTANAPANFTTRLSQQAGEFMFLNWEIEIDNAMLNLEGLEAGQEVARGNLKEGYSDRDFSLTVESISEDELILTDSEGLRFRLSKLETGGVLIENLPEEEPVIPQILTQSFEFEWSTTTPLLKLGAEAETKVIVDATLTSVRTAASSGSKFVTYGNWDFGLE